MDMAKCFLLFYLRILLCNHCKYLNEIFVMIAQQLKAEMIQHVKVTQLTYDPPEKFQFYDCEKLLNIFHVCLYFLSCVKL